MGAIVTIKEEQKILNGCNTDIDGNFSININKKELAKVLKLWVSYTSYKTQVLLLNEKTITKPFNIQMELQNIELMGDMIIIDYGFPLIDPQNPGTNTTIKSYQIEKMPH